MLGRSHAANGSEAHLAALLDSQGSGAATAVQGIHRQGIETANKPQGGFPARAKR